jgi:hypothetical protein
LLPEQLLRSRKLVASLDRYQDALEKHLLILVEHDQCLFEGAEQLQVRAQCHDRVQHFVHYWLPQHARLLQQLEIHLADGYDVYWPIAAGTALAASSLQAFTLRGILANPSVLQHLPAAHLTRLCAAIDCSSRDSNTAVARLTALRS